MSARRRRALAGAAGLAALGLLAAPSAAGATTAVEGDWYYDAAQLGEVHQITRGAGITIGVIDTAINPDAPDLIGTPLEVREPSFCDPVDGAQVPAARTDAGAQHGTAVTTWIIGNGKGDGAARPGIPGVAPEATVRFYATNPIDGEECEGAGEDEAAEEAIADGVDIVSISLDTVAIGADDVAKLLRAGIIVVAAAGNQSGVSASGVAELNGVVSVRAGGPGGVLAEGPTDPRLTVIAPGVDMWTYNADSPQYTLSTGSSIATPFTAAAIALAWSHWPDATANQILQSLVRNTGAEPHELVHDDNTGYGFINVLRMVQTDPSQYPDVNPILVEGSEYGPEPSEVTGDAAQEGEPGEEPGEEPADEPGADDTQGDDGGAAGALVPLLLVAGVVVVGGGVLVAVLVSRRRHSSPRPDGSGAPPAVPTGPGHHDYQHEK